MITKIEFDYHKLVEDYIDNLLSSGNYELKVSKENVMELLDEIEHNSNTYE